MECVKYDSVMEFTDALINIIETDEHESDIAVYGKYDFIKELLQNILAQGYPIAYEIQLEDYEVDHYNKEFVLYISEDGVDVEKVFFDGEYKNGESEICFVHNDCNSAILRHVRADMILELDIADEEDDCDIDSYGNSMSTYILKDDDGKPNGFSKYWSTNKDGVSTSSSFSYITDDLPTLRKIAEKFDVKL